MTGGMAPRRKGAAYERDVVAWLREQGWPHVERRIMGMSDDRGDITGWPDVVLECKNHGRLELGLWMRQLLIEQSLVGAAIAALFIKRKGTASVGNHYVVMRASTFTRLMKEAGR